VTNPSHRQAHQVVLAHVEKQLLTGELHNGDQLPPERELALTLGVSRSAVREAIRVLQAQGLVASRPGPGRGTRLSDFQGEALGRLFSLHLALASTSISDLTETRIALERATATLAARNAKPARLRAVERRLLAMESTLDLDTFNQLDAEFHVEIARAGNNPFIGNLTAAIRQALRDPIRAASLAMDDWQELRSDLVIQHRQIYETIRSGDYEHAATVMEAHIRTAYAVLKLDD
jgi:GntR family transcriptional repressor for pyruvate dehydrogenase complex